MYRVKSVLILLVGLLFYTSLRMAYGPFIKVGKDSLQTLNKITTLQYMTKAKLSNKGFEHEKERVKTIV